MHSATAYIPLLTSLASATFYNGGKIGTGDYYQGAYGLNLQDSFNSTPFQSAALSLVASNSVPVHGFTWRTNVSEVAVDDATTTISSNGTAIPNARVISTVFGLTWQGNGSVGSALQAQGVVAPFGCITMIDGLALPENVTSRYAAADNGSCTNVLGENCVRDFLAINVTSADGESCPSFPSTLPASCAGSLGLMNSSFGGLTENLEHLYGGQPLESEQGFAHILSAAYNGSDATAALQQAESRLQILVIKGLNVMACQKVNSSVTVTATPTPAGVAPSPTTSHSAAGGIERTPLGVVGLAMLGAVLLGL